MNMQRERLLSFLPKKTNCGHHVFRLSQQSLLKFNLTHSPLLVPSPALNADRSALARCCFMQNNTTYLQRPFLMALMWWPPDLQEEASWIPEFSSLSCFTALSERLQAKLPINLLYRPSSNLEFFIQQQKILSTKPTKTQLGKLQLA